VTKLKYGGIFTNQFIANFSQSDAFVIFWFGEDMDTS